MKARDWILLTVGAAVVGWLVERQLSKAAAALVSLPGQFGSKIGVTLYDWIHPDEGSILTSPDYIVTFPNGDRHAVNSRSIDVNGAFIYQGRVYTMKRDAAGKNYAV
jgi:hypothetical protein